jgi:hypothetical protein
MKEKKIKLKTEQVKKNFVYKNIVYIRIPVTKKNIRKVCGEN